MRSAVVSASSKARRIPTRRYYGRAGLGARKAGETPAHPNVEPVEKVRPTAAYMLGQDDVKEFPKYEKIWKEIFQIR